MDGDMDKGKPIAGKQYALTGAGKSIANGNTWAESEVKDESVLGAGTRQTEKNKIGSKIKDDYEECQDMNNPGWREVHEYNKKLKKKKN